MKALTLMQPWASAVLVLGKDVENRPWSPSDSMVGQRIAIHAGKKFDDCDVWGLLAKQPTWQREAISNAICVRGAILGTVELVGWVRFPTAGRRLSSVGLNEDQVAGVVASRWRAQEAPCAWLLREPRVLPEPIPWGGALSLWNVPPHIEAQVNASLRATGRETT